MYEAEGTGFLHKTSPTKQTHRLPPTFTVGYSFDLLFWHVTDFGFTSDSIIRMNGIPNLQFSLKICSTWRAKRMKKISLCSHGTVSKYLSLDKKRLQRLREKKDTFKEVRKYD